MPRTPPDPGKLRHRVGFQAPVAPEESQNAYGEPADSWREVLTRRAYVSPLSGRELFLAQQVKADVTHEVWCRWFAGPDPTWRLVHRGRFLNVLSAVNWEELDNWWYFLCREAVSG